MKSWSGVSSARSLFTALGVWCVIGLALLRQPPSNILSWDTFGYYLFLPATFIHHDPAIRDVEWIHEAIAAYNSTGTFYQAQQQPEGGWVLKYPMGLAVLWTPFFLAGHAVAAATDAPMDGFSAPYQWAIILGMLVYALIGLVMLRRVLLQFFSDTIAAAVIALVVMGTNYVHQALYSTGMPHLFLFTLYAGVLWHTITWHRSHQVADVIKLAVLMGLLALARPSEAVCVLIPLLAGLVRPALWKERWAVLWQWRKHLLLVVVIMLAIGAPQLLYWKWLTGKLLYMSYNNPGEGFEFLHPYTWEVLFSFRKGWFIYTPIMAVAGVGLFLLKRSVPLLQWSIIAFFAINLYVVSSWSCWWYADSFGQRALVQSYAVMALPLGAVLEWLRGRAWIWRTAAITVLLGFTALNLFQIHQGTLGLIHTSRMTWPGYKAVFARTTRPEGLEKLWLVERSYTADQGAPDLTGYTGRPFITLELEGPADGNDADYTADTVFSGDHAMRLRPGREFTPALRIPWNELTDADHVWLQVSCWIHWPVDSIPPAFSLVTTFEHKGQSYAYKAVDAAEVRVRKGEWVQLMYWYQSPEVRRPDDLLLVYGWSRGTLPVVVDAISVDRYEPRTER